MASSVPGASEELRRARASTVVVFLPGILGSSLHRSEAEPPFWGRGKPEFAAMLLPEDQLDPSRPTSVVAKVMRTFEVTLAPDPTVYVPALDGLKKAAESAGATFAPIGYDWRRDINAIVRDLDRTLRRDYPGRSLILVGHSMGGLVAWRWAAQHGGGEGGGPRARHLVLIGSPIGGSCEMFRVLSDGYTSPVVHPDYATKFAGLLRPIIDAALQSFTGDALAAAYTFPSVFQLLPPVPEEALEACLPLPTTAGRKALGDYYSAAFWSSSFGRSVLKSSLLDRYRAAGIDLPRRLEAVLARASAFRQPLAVGRLTIPIAMYTSEVFNTPFQADVHSDFAIDWTKHQEYGDGRVVWRSAVAVKPGRRYVEWYRELLSVHGDLTADERFDAHFIKGRLPALIRSYVVLDALRRLGEQPAFVDAVRRARVAPVSWEVIEAARSGESLSFEKRDDDIVADLQLVDRFARAVTAAPGDEVTRVDAAKRAQEAAKKDPTANLRTAAPLGIAARDLRRTGALGDVGKLKQAAALGRLGSALVFGDSPAAAISPLRNAQDELARLPPAIRTRYARDVREIERAVIGNLGIALHRTGQCEEAAPLLAEALALGNGYAKGYLAQPCKDGVTGRDKLAIGTTEERRAP